MLLAWHRADAVSTKEINRNNEVFNYQSNRNPFIDNPLFVEKIWGTLNATEGLQEAKGRMVLWPNPATTLLRAELTGFIPGLYILSVECDRRVYTSTFIIVSF